MKVSEFEINSALYVLAIFRNKAAHVYATALLILSYLPALQFPPPGSPESLVLSVGGYIRRAEKKIYCTSKWAARGLIAKVLLECLLYKYQD